MSLARSGPLPPAAPCGRVPPVILAVGGIAALYAWAVVALTPTHPGAIGLNLNALGTDWMVFYGGARWFFDGHLALLFDGERFTTYLNTAFSGWLSQPTPFRPWVYPPSYLVVLLPFGLLPFGVAYAAFQLVTAALLAAALAFRVERRAPPLLVVAIALLGPAAAMNVGMGQNAFLTASLLIGGFRLLPQRPALAGAVLGLLTVKPQFWLLVPVALAAQREWKALGWSFVAAGALALASVALFGVESWQHWLDLARGSYDDAQSRWVELGRLWGGSIYACLVSAGVSPGIAKALQLAGTLLGVAAVYRCFRLPGLARDMKIAVLLAAMIFAAPHSSLADLALLGAAAALAAGDALRRDASFAQWTLVLALWVVAAVNPPLISPVGRLTPLLLLAFVAATMFDRRAATLSQSAPDPAGALRRLAPGA